MIATAKIKPKSFDIILVCGVDGFAESREDSIVYKSLLQKECGIKVVPIAKPITEDKLSAIYETVIEAMIDYYYMNFGEDIKKRMTEKAERDWYKQEVPFGYIMQDEQLEVVYEEAKVVYIIFDEFSYHSKSALQLALHLNKIGIKTKEGYSIRFQMIDYILNNPVYIGKPPTGSKSQDADHEAIIDIGMWNKAQERIKADYKSYRKNYYKTPDE